MGKAWHLKSDLPQIITAGTIRVHTYFIVTEDYSITYTGRMGKP